MVEGFDYAAYQREQRKENPDKALLVTFEYKAEPKPDGTFENVEYTRIWLSKNDEIVRKTTDDDRARFLERYESFLKGEEKPPDGTPLGNCPFVTPADVAACKAERIFTAEQLAEVPDERLRKALLVNLKYKCRDFLEARARTGYVGEMRDQIEALKAQVEALKERQVPDQSETIETLKAEIDQLKAKRRPGRPKKNAA